MMKKIPSKKDVLNDLYLFYRYYIASQYPNSVPAPHIKKLSRKLLKLAIGEGKNRLAVSMPPRHSKSSMVTLAYPLWLIFRNPNLKILIVNNSASLSEKFGIQLREFIKKIGPEFGVFLSDVKRSSTHIMFTDANGQLYDGSV